MGERTKGEQAVKAAQNELEREKLEREKQAQIMAKLQFELNHAQNSPGYLEYETLLRQLQKLEKAYLRLLQTSDDVEERLHRKHGSIVEAKNAQIRSLQGELSTLMTAFEKIKQ